MANANIFSFNDTWNDAGTTFSAIKVNVTDTASQADSTLIDLEVGGASQASVTKAGEVICKGLTSSQNIDLQGNRLVMDADNDTYLEATTDDRLDVVVGGTLVARFDASAADTFQLDGVGFSPTGAVVGQALGFPNSATTVEPYTPAGGGDVLKAANETVTGSWDFTAAVGLSDATFSGDADFSGATVSKASREAFAIYETTVDDKDALAALTGGDFKAVRVANQKADPVFTWLSGNQAASLFGGVKAVTAGDVGADTLTVTSHGYLDGYKVRTGASAVAGVSASTDYFVGVVDSNTIQLFTSLRNFADGSPVDITSATTTGLTVQLLKDPKRGVYVPPDSDSTGASGVWVRLYDGLHKASSFDAVGDGVADDVDALSAAVSFVNNIGSGGVFLASGDYKVSAPVTSLIGTNKAFVGENMYTTFITSTYNGDILSADARTAAAFFHDYRDLTLRREAGGTYSSSCGIRIKGDTSSVTGLQYANFENIQFSNLYRGIIVEDTGKYSFGSFTENTRHGFFNFVNLIAAVATDPMFECVVFEGGTGPHHTFRGGQIRGSNAAVRLGTSGNDFGIGDILFTGVHVVTAGVGIDVYGPNPGGLPYNQNVNIIGCQFDNCSVATVRMDRMQNFRIFGNNSTSSVGVTLTNCTNYISEDRNNTTLQDLILQGDLTASTIVGPTTHSGVHTFSNTADFNNAIDTTGGFIQDSNGLRHAQTVVARRTVDDSFSEVRGGASGGGKLTLYGGSNASFPNQCFLDVSRFRQRSANGATTYIDTDPNNNITTIGDGAWNGHRLALGSYQLWVDSTGDLRIKNGAPTSDTDGTIVGTQS